METLTCIGCGGELFEHEAHFGICSDCCDNAGDLEDLMDVALSAADGITDWAQHVAEWQQPDKGQEGRDEHQP